MARSRAEDVKLLQRNLAGPSTPPPQLGQILKACLVATSSKKRHFSAITEKTVV